MARISWNKAIMATAGALLVTGAVAVVMPASAAAAGCSIHYAVSSQWQGGFGASVTIDNLGDPLTDWRLSWSFTDGQKITQLWNGAVTQSGSLVTVTNLAYNGQLATKGSTTFGFNATSASSNPAPTSFALNGVACTGAATSAPTNAPPPPNPTTQPVNRPTTGTLPCDVYASGGTPCVAAHSTTRALLSSYQGPLYQVKRWSDNATADVGVLAAGGYANAAAQDSFCSGTYCTIVRIYDQTSRHNDLTIAPGGGANPTADQGANAAALPVTAGGHRVYGVYISAGNGYRNDATNGVSTGSQPEGLYMVTEGTHVNDRCCFDYGNAETNNLDTGNGDMDAIYFGTLCWFSPCTTEPRVAADLENGLFSGGDGSWSANTGRNSAFVTAMLKNDGTSTYAIKDGNAQSGDLTTRYNGALPSQPGYRPMSTQGAIILGVGGDNSNGSVGSFFEGVMTSGYPSDATENAVQSNIASVGYQKNVTVPTNGTAYRLTNLASGKTMDAANCGRGNGTAVDVWDALGTGCQQWRFTSVGANTWTITNVNSGTVLDAVQCGQALGTAVDLWQPLGNQCQQWAVIPAGNGRYELVVENSGMVLDDQDCGTANGTNVRLWMWLNNTCQLWSIEP